MRKFLSILLLLFGLVLQAQSPQKLNSAEIHEALKKLNFLGSVLYIAAHPDDENTRLISYLANEVHARTGYLSITRGDGGQNLIGPELKELLGIIRTQELLGARNIDGGEQLFTRAIDFGYTKTPEEALDFWQKDEVLGDVVWAIRTFQPDVIINRFNHRTSGETHGQHTASALLAVEAFELAFKKDAFSHQLSHTELFQPKHLYFNTSPWFYGNDEEFQKARKDNFLQFDTGIYFPSMGLSNPEIAALSRSEHQSQGFGSTGTRGEQMEYLERINSHLPGENHALFAGIDTSWGRLNNGAAIGTILEEVESNYNFKDPSASIPKLLEAYTMIQKLENSSWKHIKSAEIKEIIASAAGLYLEAIASTPTSTPGELVNLNLEVINRSNFPMNLKAVVLQPNDSKLTPNKELLENASWKETAVLKIGQNAQYSSPYWLNEKGSIGLYNVTDQNLIGLPEAPKKIKAGFFINMNGVEIPFERPVVYKYNDPVKGEVYQPFEVLPIISARFNENVQIFSNGKDKSISVYITAGRDNVAGEIALESSGTWKITPATKKFEINKKGETVTVIFSITPPTGQGQIVLTPVITAEGNRYSKEVVRIDYDHIPLQTLVVPAETKLVKLNIEKKGENIGYIEGAGDVIPQSLRQIGYKVSTLNPAIITPANIAQYDAIVLGIRAYNTVEELKYAQTALLKYVENGGTLIVQYNVNRGLTTNQMAPFKLNLSRDRVTEEDASVRFLAPNHPILNTPNKISPADFEGWVQERGLYFADSWAPEFTPLLSMNDTNETPKEGSLVVAKHGKGYFIYTGLSFFRQFPEGVPGAFRLFANMVSIGK